MLRVSIRDIEIEQRGNYLNGKNVHVTIANKQINPIVFFIYISISCSQAATRIKQFL